MRVAFFFFCRSVRVTKQFTAFSIIYNNIILLNRRKKDVIIYFNIVFRYLPTYILLYVPGIYLRARLYYTIIIIIIIVII